MHNNMNFLRKQLAIRGEKTIEIRFINSSFANITFKAYVLHLQPTG